MCTTKGVTLLWLQQLSRVVPLGCDSCWRRTRDFNNPWGQVCKSQACTTWFKDGDSNKITAYVSDECEHKEGEELPREEVEITMKGCIRLWIRKLELDPRKHFLPVRSPRLHSRLQVNFAVVLSLEPLHGKQSKMLGSVQEGTGGACVRGWTGWPNADCFHNTHMTLISIHKWIQ